MRIQLKAIIVVITVIFLVGCVGTPIDDSSGVGDEKEVTDETELSDNKNNSTNKNGDSSSRDTPVDRNPWGEKYIDVKINYEAESKHNYKTLTNESIEYWNNNIRKLGYGGKFRFAEDGDDVDVVVNIQEEVNGKTKGYAPINDGVNTANERSVIQIENNQKRLEAQSTLTHEFGHTLGLRHTDSLEWPIMYSQYDSTYQPLYDNHWQEDNILVYFDSSDETMAFGEQEVDEIRYAIEYINEGADGYVNESVAVSRTNNKESADIVIEKVEDLSVSEDWVYRYYWRLYTKTDGGLHPGISGTIRIESGESSDYYSQYVAISLVELLGDPSKNGRPDPLSEPVDWGTQWHG